MHRSFSIDDAYFCHLHCGCRYGVTCLRPVFGEYYSSRVSCVCVCVCVSVCVCVGSVIFYQCDVRLPGIQNRVGGLFMICIFLALTRWFVASVGSLLSIDMCGLVCCSMSALGIFVTERKLFLREYQAGAWLPFVLCSHACV